MSTPLVVDTPTAARYASSVRSTRRMLARALRCICAFGLATLFACKQTSDVGPQFFIAPDTASLTVGQSIQLTARNIPSEATWSTSNAQVATVIAKTGFVQAVGRGDATITASTGNASANARIHVTVPPALGLSKPTVDFDVTFGDADPPTQSITVTNAGDGNLGNVGVGSVAYGAGEPQGWLTVTPSGSAAPVTLTLAAKTQAFARGTYTAIVPVTAPGIANSPQNLAVTLHVLAPASIVLSRSSVSLPAIKNSTADDSVAISNGGDRPLTGLTRTITYSGTAQNWLQASLSATTAPTTLKLTATSTGLDTGSYNATVRVSSSVAGVASKDLAVTLVVGPGPSISLSRTTVAVAASNGQNAPTQTVNITNGGGGKLTDLSLGPISPASTAWVTAALDVTTAPAVVTLTFATASLSTGSFTATIPVLSPVASNTPATITVTLTMGPPPSMSLNPTSVTFSGWNGGTTPGQQPVQVTNIGGGTLNGLSFSISYGAGATGWLSGSFQGGTTAPTTLLLQPNTTSLASGTYSATVTVSSTVSGVTPRTVSVSYVIQSFSVDAYPKFSSSATGFSATPCTNCHFSGGRTPNLTGGAAAVRTTLLAGYVTPGNDSPSASKLVCKITGDASCPSPSGTNMTMPSAWVSIIRSWIRAGAPP
jgi:hypothetical protein